MSTNSNIQWTEATWNPIAGCTPNSPGCLNCYAATMSNRLGAMGQAKYRGLTVLHNGRHTFNGTISYDEPALSSPLKRKKPTLYFVNSMSDLFHEAVPFDFVDRVFAVMALCPQHTFQVLTKRPERMAKYASSHDVGLRWAMASRPLANGAMLDWPTPETAVDWTRRGLPNVWLGCSPVNQKTYDTYREHMERVPAAVRFLSLEPLLDDVNLGPAPPFDWIIVGGESGSRARICRMDWIASIAGQCRLAEIPCFVKQLGGNVHGEWIGDNEPRAWLTSTITGFDGPIQNRHKNGRWKLIDKKGGTPDEWPVDLRVREMPTPKATVPA